jgi:membrane protein implicated in regulation of membrane protease activity
VSLLAVEFWQQVVLLVIGAVLTTGAVAALFRFLRQGPSGTFTIEAAKGATILQTTVLEKRVDELEKDRLSVRDMSSRIETLTVEKVSLEKRVSVLERENADLKAQLAERE